jgi:hypothetical protein
VATQLTSVVPRSALGPLELIHSGGFGKVFLVKRFRLGENPTALAYKEFTSDHDLQARAARKAVDLRDGLDQKDRAVLDELSAWPLGLVENSRGQVCGLLMPLLPPDFFTRLIDPYSGNIDNKPRDLAWLVASRAQREVARVDVPDVELTDRLVLLAQLCYVVAWLHRRGWVYGDINLHNVAFALAPARIKLVDCDAAAPLSDMQRRQGHQAGWEPPENPIPGGSPMLQDTVTDVYKLGLAILRGLTPGKHASTRKSARRLCDVLDPSGLDLVSKALGDRAQRPSARELYRYLQQTAQARMDPPHVVRIDIPGAVWPRGQDVRITWQVTGATEAVITSGDALQGRVDPSVHVTGYTIRPTVSGPLLVTFRNRYGVVTIDLGQLRLFDLPAFPLPGDVLPRPVVPPLPAFAIPHLPSLDIVEQSEKKVPAPRTVAPRSAGSVTVTETLDEIREFRRNLAGALV